MNSSLIGKIEKAKAYAREPSRFAISSMTATVRGDNGEHEVSVQDGAWHCNCDFFDRHSICSHTMALERLLQGIVPAQPKPETAAT